MMAGSFLYIRIRYKFLYFVFWYFMLRFGCYLFMRFMKKAVSLKNGGKMKSLAVFVLPVKSSAGRKTFFQLAEPHIVRMKKNKTADTHISQEIDSILYGGKRNHR